MAGGRLVIEGGGDFTTGQVARICKVAPRTVSKWFDSGRLKGYRLPGGEDRRVPRENLVRFLKEHGMPLGDLDDRLVVACGLAERDAAALAAGADASGRAVEWVLTAFAVAARLAGPAFSGAVVLAAHVGREAIRHVGGVVASDTKFKDVQLVVVGADDTTPETVVELTRLGADQVVIPPVDWADVLGLPARAK